uniref:WH1 domain-containing protein n=1 Tax=Anopheles melas TaxID=34690 RepID=A0A182TNJ6_9DIPT
MIHKADDLPEQSIIGARASVMVYDDVQRKWIPSGSSSGLSKVQIFHHQQNNTFRVVGRKLQDHEVVINCSIIKGLKYNQATATFHQWRDSKFVYGLNFSSPMDAEAFARAMMHALDVLSGRVPPSSTMQTTNPNPSQMAAAYEEDMGYRTMTREDAAIMQQQQQMTSQPPGVGPPQQPPNSIPGPGGGILSPQTPTSQTLPSQATQQQQQQQQQQTHHRTNR